MPAAPPDALNRKVTDSEQTQKECDEIEADLVALKVTYEQYFLGLERQPPTERHAALRRRVNGLRNSFVRQTGMKFRVGNLMQKFLTYERLWQRTLQEMENGTYRRDLFKARIHSQKRQGAEVPKATAEAAAAAAPAKGEAAKKGPESAPKAPAAAAAPPPAPTGGLSESKIKAIYDAYVTAKRRCGEDATKVSYDGLAATLRKQVPELMKQHKAKSVEFKVVIKDGKAVLRAVPRE